MNLLICGAGKGSWQMRGVQIGAALGARVTSHPADADWKWADVAILLKKQAECYTAAAHRFDVPIVWDVLDIWQQPAQNGWSIADGIRHVRSLQARIKPVVMIAATQAMAQDIGGVYIPHHTRIGLRPTLPRMDMKTIAYEGSERYLGAWREPLERICREHGWTFAINPESLAETDLLVAFRDGAWDGPLCRRWKSGVKYANAISAARPILTQACAGFDEIKPCGWTLEQPSQLADVLRCVIEYDRRRDAAAIQTEMAPAFAIETIVETYYRPLLESVLTGAPCAA